MSQTRVLSDFRVQSDKTVSRETFWYDWQSAQTHFSAREWVRSRDLAQADDCDRVHAGVWLPSRMKDRRGISRGGSEKPTVFSAQIESSESPSTSPAFLTDFDPSRLPFGA
jgi:hypothetical protein